ncbi:MAG: cyclase family protein [Pseudomonadales bacterium]|nr:cyclase family protein [Pseudomonadales bacterium]
MKLIDLTRLLDTEDYDRLPERVKPSSVNIVPTIEYVAPAEGGAEVMCQIFGCEKHHLPEGEGWGEERLKINTHLGTHVDAPLHYGSHCEGKPSRTIEQIGLDELFCDGLVLDLRGLVDDGVITVSALKEALSKNGTAPTTGCAILLRTGQERYAVSDMEWYNYPGMTRESTLFLAGLGAKVLGTDSLGWDRPFHVMRRAFRDTGNAAEIWDGHFAGRDSEVFIVQQLDNLKALPPSGFKVGFFPLRLAHCSAAPARVVAFVD